MPYSKKGFTLVELLLVIAIIGILATVLYVTVGGQRERAKVSAFKESMRSEVPAATICHDQEATILDSAAAGDPICNPDNGDDYPNILNCNSDGSFVQTTVVNPAGDNWQLTAVCDRTNSSTCTAVCDVTGCQFNPSAGNACN